MIEFKIAIIAVVYSTVLTGPNQLLNKLYLFLERWLSPEFDFIFYPVIGCSKCVGGQIALWSYLITNTDYKWYEHIFSICLTIGIVIILEKIYRECKN